jgi:hypothetical protein
MGRNIYPNNLDDGTKISRRSLDKTDNGRNK